ncbi:GDYXXLXY domain-containing protein [Desulfovibrio sp. OttesenSCG-928-A18]|nr:GDYXXLXY domain-containing protein [Desulfovibrio sp. OttesenSCG-928-A18]
MTTDTYTPLPQDAASQGDGIAEARAAAPEYDNAASFDGTDDTRGLDPDVEATSWALFWRFFCANAGLLFLMAGVICFFAYNWEAMSPFAKFSTLGALLLGSGAVVLWRGLYSIPGSIALLACGILGGALMAVYGQVYQTGANAWELFRSWALYLVPLALLSRRAGLWCLLWIVANLWAIFYLQQFGIFDDMGKAIADYVLYVILANTLALVVWEGLSRMLAGPRRLYLYTRWLPRLMAFCLIGMLTCIMASHIMNSSSPFMHTTQYSILYIALLAGGAVHYYRSRPDLFMILIGLLSLIFLIIFFLSQELVLRDTGKNTALLLILVLAILISAAIAAKILIFCHKQFRKQSLAEQDAAPDNEAGLLLGLSQGKADPSGSARSLELSPAMLRFAMQGGKACRRRAKSRRTEAGETSAPPWQARVLQGLCAWVAMPFLIGFVVLLFGFDINKSSLLVIFNLLFIFGIGISHAPGIFSGQAALCLCISGAVAASILSVMEFSLNVYYLLPLTLFCLVAYLFTRRSPIRFLAVMFGTGSLFVQAAIAVFPSDHYRRGFFVNAGSGQFAENPDGLFLTLGAFALAYALLCILLARLWHTRCRKQGLALYKDPLLAGLFAALVLLGLAPGLSYSSELAVAPASFMRIHLQPLSMIGIGAGAGLVLLCRSLVRDLELAPGTSLFFQALALVIAVASWWLPWLGVGFFLLALARLAASIPLFGLSVIYLSAATFIEYYTLSSSLLSKSFSLSTIGIICLAAAWGVHRLLARSIRARLSLSSPASTKEAQGPEAVAGTGAEQDAPGPGAERKAAQAGKGRKEWRNPLAALSSSAFALCLAAFCVFFVMSVQGKEALLAEGRVMILSLAPVDPRSLMQGDYMILYLDIEDSIRTELRQQIPDDGAPDARRSKGTVIVAPDNNGVWQLVELDNGRELNYGEGRLLYRGRGRGVRVGAGSFFFQEGRGRAFAAASFVELRVDDATGESLFTHLLDNKKQRIEPGREPLPEKDDPDL